MLCVVECEGGRRRRRELATVDVVKTTAMRCVLDASYGYELDKTIDGSILCCVQ